MRMQRLVIGLVVMACLVGCATPQQIKTNRPTVDLSVLECGYRWFQTGYSQYYNLACDADRTFLKSRLTQAANAHAWEVAQKRCPARCPPVQLQETTPWKNPQADGVCREDNVYFLTRVFFQCQP